MKRLTHYSLAISAALFAIAPIARAEPAALARNVDAAIAAAKPHDLSIASMFMNADIVVKIVMIGLLIASIATWTVLIAKTIELKASHLSLISQPDAIARLIVEAAGV